MSRWHSSKSSLDREVGSSGGWERWASVGVRRLIGKLFGSGHSEVCGMSRTQK